MFLGRGGHRHGFAHKTAEQRKRRDGGGSDHAADRCKGHGFVKPAQIRGPDPAGHVEHGPGGHKQQGLVDDVAKGMGHHSVDGQLGADADAAYHKPDLVDQAVGQHPAHVVDDNGIKYGKTGHECSGPDQGFRPGERSCQDIDRTFRGQGAHEHRPADRGPGG